MASSVDKEEGFSNDDETRREKTAVRGETNSIFLIFGISTEQVRVFLSFWREKNVRLVPFWRAGAGSISRQNLEIGLQLIEDPREKIFMSSFGFRTKQNK